MTSVIPVPIPIQPLARAPRNVRAKSLQLASFKSKDNPTAGAALTFPTVTEAAAYLDSFLEIAQSTLPEKDMKSAVLTLCANLKLYGAQLEIHYKDQLDQVFVHLRNAGRDESLDKISRLHLLEVIELRAGRWLSQEQVCSYYQSKLVELETTTSSDVTAVGGQPAAPASTQTDNSPPASPLPLLQPGEVVKYTGKFDNTNNLVTTAQAKSFIKDEVVIRNADSGKVMGIKGRRVHLIEEISDTVISFQRVGAGDKERRVQITGPAVENIEHAKQLMEQTIQRNASPVRQLEPSASGATLTQETAQRRESLLLDAALDEYQYSVVIGDHTLKITGSNLELVQSAKLVLDEYFANSYSSNRQRTGSCSTDDGLVMCCTPQESPRGPATAPYKKMLKYNRELLLMVSNSPLCRGPPANFSLVLANAPEIVRQNEHQQDVASSDNRPESAEGLNLPSNN